MSEIHKPFTDDGVTYCGWDGYEGCGELWPCSAVQFAGTQRDTLTSFIATNGELVKAQKTVKRVKELVKAFDHQGLDVPTAELRIAIEGEK